MPLLDKLAGACETIGDWFRDKTLECATDTSCCSPSTVTVARVLAPAGVAYACGMAAEEATAHAIAACTCCACWKPAMTAATVALVAGCVRTHIPVVYQLDVHRALWQWIANKCNLNAEDQQPLLLVVKYANLIDRQPLPQSINADATPADYKAPEKLECSRACWAFMSIRIATRGVAAIAPGFAMGSMPGQLANAYCIDTPAAREIFTKPEIVAALQSVVPSICAFWQRNRDDREAFVHRQRIEQAVEHGKTVANQPR